MAFLKRWWLSFVGNFLLWGVPLIILIIMFFEQGMAQYRLNMTGILILAVILFIYFKKLKAVIRDGKLASKIKVVDGQSRGKPHPIWRIIQLFIYIAEIGIGLLAVDLVVQIGGGLRYYLILIASFGIVGYVLLAIDDGRLVEEEPVVPPEA